jgi:hypothetical protein
MRTACKVFIHFIFFLIWLFYSFLQIKKLQSEENREYFSNTELKTFKKENEFPLPDIFQICSSKSIKPLISKPNLPWNYTQNSAKENCIDYKTNHFPASLILVEFENNEKKISLHEIYGRVAFASRGFISQIVISLEQTKKLITPARLLSSEKTKILNRYIYSFLGIQRVKNIFNTSNTNVAGFYFTTHSQYILIREEEKYTYLECLSWILAMLGFFELIARLIIFVFSSCCCSNDVRQLTPIDDENDPRKLNYSLLVPPQNWEQ